MAEIAGRSANQLGHLVLHLKLAAIDFDDLLLAAVQQLGNRFDSFCLTGSGRTEQQEDAGRAPLGSEARLIHVDIRHDRLGRGRLPHHFL